VCFPRPESRAPRRCASHFSSAKPTIAALMKRDCTLLIAFVVALPAFAQTQTNPFSAPSPLLFQAPQFDKITDADFQPAIDEGMRQHLAEIEAIANSTDPPTFENTIVAMERSGAMLTRAQRVFGALTQSNTNPT